MSLYTSRYMRSFSGNNNSDQFGGSVAISADGKTIVIGAPQIPGSTIGNIYVTTRINGVWSNIQQSVPVVKRKGSLGCAVAISSDGSVILAGQVGYFMIPGLVAGGVISIINGIAGNTFQAVTPTPLNGDLFGTAIALSYDGKIAAIGAPGISTQKGFVYIFERSDTLWAQKTVLSDYDGSDGYGFGQSISMSADGSRLVVGTNLMSGGHVSIFTCSDTVWTQYHPCLTSSDEGFGKSVAISADGSTIAVGAPIVNISAGAVHVYTQFDSTWLLQARLTGDNMQQSFLGTNCCSIL